MGKKQKHPEHVNHERWLVSYADFMTLLFAFFVVMFASSQVDSNKMGRFTQAFHGATTWNMFDEPGAGMMPSQDTASVSGLKEARKGAKKGRDKDAAKEDAPPPEAPTKDLKKALEQKLKSKPELVALHLIEAHGEIILRLPERLLFDVGAAEVRPQGREAVIALANELGLHDVSVRVEGHTDSAPIHTAQFPSNWELSGARAMNVLRVISETKQMAPDRLSASGYGEYHPISPNDTNEGRAQNRRVDLVIVVGPDAKATGAE